MACLVQVAKSDQNRGAVRGRKGWGNGGGNAEDVLNGGGKGKGDGGLKTRKRKDPGFKENWLSVVAVVEGWRMLSLPFGFGGDRCTTTVMAFEWNGLGKPTGGEGVGQVGGG